MSIGIRVSQSIAGLLSMMLDPLNILEGSAKLLQDRISPDEMPSELLNLIQAIDKASEKLKSEVKNLYRSIEQEFDVNSPVKAVSQIQQKVSQWEDDEMILVNAVRRIRDLRDKNLRLKDPQLDAILGEVVLDSFYRLLRCIDCVNALEGKELIYGSRRMERFSYLFPRSLMKDSEVGYPTTSIARRLVYELTWPLEGLLFGHSSLKENAPHEILAPMEAIGKCSEKFLAEVKSFGNACLKETDLTPDKAVAQIHQQVKEWKAYETELSNAIRQIREALASGLKMDADTEAVIAGAFFDAFEHLEREMRRLETIQAEDF